MTVAARVSQRQMVRRFIVDRMFRASDILLSYPCRCPETSPLQHKPVPEQDWDMTFLQQV